MPRGSETGGRTGGFRFGSGPEGHGRIRPVNSLDHTAKCHAEACTWALGGATEPVGACDEANLPRPRRRETGRWKHGSRSVVTLSRFRARDCPGGSFSVRKQSPAQSRGGCDGPKSRDRPMLSPAVTGTHGQAAPDESEAFAGRTYRTRAARRDTGRSRCGETVASSRRSRTERPPSRTDPGRSRRCRRRTSPGRWRRKSARRCRGKSAPAWAGSGRRRHPPSGRR